MRKGHTSIVNHNIHTTLMLLFQKLPQRSNTLSRSNIQLPKLDRHAPALLHKNSSLTELCIVKQSLHSFFAALRRASGEVDEEGSACV